MSKLVLLIVTCVAVLLLATPARADYLGQASRPLPPTDLQVQAVPAGNQLAWQPPVANPGAPLSGYNVYRLVDGIEEFVASVSASTTTYLDTDVSPDHAYVYLVTSESASGESAPAAAPGLYPWCLDIVFINPPEINWTCILPLPLPFGILIH